MQCVPFHSRLLNCVSNESAEQGESCASAMACCSIPPLTQSEGRHSCRGECFPGRKKGWEPECQNVYPLCRDGRGDLFFARYRNRFGLSIVGGGWLEGNIRNRLPGLFMNPLDMQLIGIYLKKELLLNKTSAIHVKKNAAGDYREKFARL